MKNAFNCMTEPGNNGFVMVFPNGVAASIRWGTNNYSDRGQTTAEAAAWIAREDGQVGEWVHVDGFQWDCDDVLPRMSPMEVAFFLYNISNGKFVVKQPKRQKTEILHDVEDNLIDYWYFTDSKGKFHCYMDPDDAQKAWEADE